MTNITFNWDNWVDSSTVAYSSQQSNFPASNIIHRWATRSWRSRYGAGTGWGRFVIESGVNDALDFNEGGGELNATITAGTYTADTLAAEIKIQLDAEGGDTYTVTYSSSTNKFTIASDGSTFELMWDSGTNTATTIGSSIGFSVTADDTGALTYTADNIAIHTEEWIVSDLGSAKAVWSVCLKKFNFSASAVVKIQANATNVWSSPSVNVTLSLVQDLKTHYFTSAQTYRYWRIYIQDAANDDGYIELGRVFIGPYLSPTKNINKNYSTNYADPSDSIMSDGGQISNNLKTKYRQFTFKFDFMSAADLALMVTMWNAVGHTKGFFFTLDRDNNDTTSYYAMYSQSMTVNHLARESLYEVSIHIEELR